MQLVRKDKPTIGDCEGCTTSVNTEVWRMHGNMLLCATCREKELALMAQSPSVPTPVITPLAAEHTIKQFGKSQALTGQADIYNALTVPFVELRAAIFANPAIADDAKQNEYVKQLNDHMVNLRRILMETQISIQICQTTGQSAAMELHESERAKYIEFDPDLKNIARYTKPAAVRKAAVTLPTKPKAKSTGKADSIAAFEAAKKYPGMDGANVLMFMQAHKCDAAKAAELVLASGLYKKQ